LRLECQFLPSGVRGGTAIVIDVLRMSTTAVILMEAGLRELVVAADIDAARSLAASAETLLLGERSGVKLEGFNGGNSPLEYLGRDLSGQRAVICTSNGSRAVEASAGADGLMIGTIRNAGAVAEAALVALADPITLVCAGTGGHVSFDDVVGAGVIVRELKQRAPGLELDDAARLALHSFGGHATLNEALRAASHASTLKRLGYDGDIDFAAALDASSAVPRLSSRRPPTFVSRPPRAPGSGHAAAAHADGSDAT
jgi:2-phosphosulfolactate phosphatase